MRILFPILTAVMLRYSVPSANKMFRRKGSYTVETNGKLTTRVDREDGSISIVGLLPSGMLAEDLESKRVRGMIVEASNPLLACSNPDGRLDMAFAGLDLLVCIDLFRSKAGKLADYISHLSGIFVEIEPATA